jgi:uncharacterized protein (DUF58 family)
MLRALLADPRLRDWFYGYRPPERGAIVLGQRRIYIVPTRMGLFYGAAIGILLVGSINYASALGFALTFLLAGVGLAAMVHTARNLAQLALSAGRVEAVFCGESAQFRLYLANPASFDRPEILLRRVESNSQCVVGIGAAASVEAVLAVPAARRGWLALGRVMLETRFPLGIFRAWSYVEPAARCIVYPRPEASRLPPPQPGARSGATRAQVAGSEDFAGLRNYQRSDSPRQVAWKAVARTDEMLTKQFSGETAAEVRFDLRQLPLALGLERRLSRLAGWVLAAERSGVRYALRLPGTDIALGRGDAHRTACLQALALYQQQ